MTQLNGAFDEVIRWVFSHGTLSQFPRVVHFIGKENGGVGWEDSYQNLLIDRLLASPWFKAEGNDFFSCAPDGTTWYRSSYEWRMGAYKTQLTLARGSEGSVGPPIGALEIKEAFFSEDFFRTVGAEPRDVTRVSLADAVQYLTTLGDGAYLNLSSATSTAKSKPRRRKWWWLIDG